MLTKTTVMKFLLRIQLVEIQLLEPPSSQQIPLPPLLEMLSDLSPTLGKLLPDEGEWWWWEHWWYLIWGWSWWCYLWWWFLCQSNTAINQMCSPQSIHDQRWNKVLCCHPSPLHVWTTENSPAPLSGRNVWERKCHNVFSEKFWRVSRAAHGRTILHCLAASLASTTQDTNTKTKMIKTHKNKHQHKTQN